MFAGSYFGQGYFGDGPLSASGTVPAVPNGLAGMVVSLTATVLPGTVVPTTPNVA